MKNKVNLVLIAAFALLALTVFVVQRVIVFPSFVSLEVDEADKDMSRGVDGIRREIEHLSILCGDWSAWNDTYQFVVDHNQDYIDDNLVATSFENNHLDYLIVLNDRFEPMWHGGPDADYEDVHGIDALANQIATTPWLRPPMQPEQDLSGILMTAEGPVMVSLRPIFTSLNEGPARGVLVMGRRLDDAAVQAVADRARVDLKAWPVDRAPADDRAMLGSITEDQPMALRHTGGLLQVYTSYPGIDGKPALLLRADVPAAISMRGTVASRYAVITTLALGAAVVVFISVVFNAMVVAPVLRVTRHAKRIAADERLQGRLNMKRGDEIGQLADEFDRMVAQLAEAQSKALDAAHRAGLADNASEVLHNIGNALNSVNVSNEMMRERLRASKLGGLARATEMIEEHRGALAEFLTADPRGPKLVDYLLKLSSLLSDEQRSMLAETESLAEKVAHIRDVVSMQQSYVTHARFIQPVEPARLLDEAISMQQATLDRHGIGVERDYRQPLPELSLHKPRLMQVLVNLVKNAVESMIAAETTALAAGGAPRAHVLTARAYGMPEGVVLEVVDTGVGIAPEARARLFQSGFTTKSTGSGIGLHFCANAIKTMNGAITVDSAGVGQGATFRIVLRHPEPASTTPEKETVTKTTNVAAVAASGEQS